VRVFVHGVPETAVIWDDLRNALTGPSVALSLPGFGTPLPAGFTPAKDDYAAWLTEELKRIPGPIDLVGHDWGALLALRVATAGEVPLRSWVADCGSVFHPDYRWHPWAATLIEPGAGEAQLLRRQQSSPAEAGALMASGGVPARTVAEMAAALDDVMSRSILGLYRSAVPNVAVDWGAQAQAPTAAPGMLLLPTGDRVDSESLSRQVADRLGARFEILDGLSHWWMCDEAGTVVFTLEKFWTAVPAS
jgi:pimeloyl-ACP methyl ester carboxylesterase